MSDNQEGDDQGGTRFPFINLEKALGRAKQLFDAAGAHSMTSLDVFSTWNYSPKSSGGFQTVAALKAYGLLGNFRTGSDTGKLGLLPDALKYFRDERPEERLQLVKQFALEPSLFRALWQRWGFTPPADHIARSHLKIDRHLSEQSARAVLGIYQENIDFAKLKSETESIREEPRQEERAPPQPLGGSDSAPSPRAFLTGKAEIMAGERELTTGLLSKDSNFRLIVSGWIGAKEIERLIKKLELDKEILADSDDDESAAE